MNTTSLRTIVAGVTLAFVGFACGTEAESDLSAPSTPVSTTSNCPAPRLNPSYVPPGFETVTESPLIESAEWANTWRSGDEQFQVLGGFSADRGDDPTAKNVSVRGREAQVGPVAIQSGNYPAINWDEESECGLHQYAVVGRGVSDQQLVQIADSLVDADGSVADRY